MLEKDFQKKFIRELEAIFDGCILIKNDAGYIQGFPDWTMFYKNKYAVLEIKKNKNAQHQPNQDYYVDLINSMGFARFVYPENKNDVIEDLKRYFKKRK